MVYQWLSILRPKKMDDISQTIFSNAFSWMKIHEFRLNCPWNLFLMVQLRIFQHWFELWLGVVQEPSHYLNQWCLVYQRIYALLGLSELKWTTMTEGVVYLWLNHNKTVENMDLWHIYIYICVCVCVCMYIHIVFSCINHKKWHSNRTYLLFSCKSIIKNFIL